MGDDKRMNDNRALVNRHTDAKKNMEKLVGIAFLLCSCFAILCVLVISAYLLARGVPAIAKVGLFSFLGQSLWEPMAEEFGILTMVVGSLYSALGAILIGVPIGLFTAVYMAEIAPPPVVKILQPAIDLLAGIPSIVYGFFGLIVIVPLIDSAFGSGGNSLLAAIAILATMILPTIINISGAALKAVPDSYREGALGLGANKIESIFTVIVPAARSGIMAGVILGIGRAIGETMAVILVAGNTPIIPTSILSRFRSMTATIAMEMSYSTGLHQDVLFGIGVMLFLLIMILNFALNMLNKKGGAV